MLNKETLDQFTKEANKGRNQFCVWMYAYNNFIKHQKEFNAIVIDWFYAKDKAIENSCKYKNFWTTVIPSLQYWRVLSVAKLIDPPYFRWNKNKARLSMYYILEQIDDTKFKSQLGNWLNEENNFIESIKKIRDNFLAHNNIWETTKKINKWVESFFTKINNIIIKIKEEYPHLKDCNDINLEYTEELSKAGVKELFEKIT